MEIALRSPAVESLMAFELPLADSFFDPSFSLLFNLFFLIRLDFIFSVF